MTGKKRAIAGSEQMRRAAASIALTLLVASIMPATPLLARDEVVEAQVQPIEIGQPKTGSFEVTPPDAWDQLPHDDYRLRLEQGQTVRISMDSPDPTAAATPAAPDAAAPTFGFDPYLELRLEGSEEILRSDDDSGEGVNSRITFSAPSAGTYIIRARPLSPPSAEQIRTYRLLVEAVAAPPPPGEFTGSRVEGDLDERSPQDEAYDSVRFADYWFEGRAGERVRFEMATAEPGSGLVIIDAAGAILGTNSAYDTNRVQLIAVIQTTGRHLVRAQVPNTGTTHYTVEMTRAMTTARPAQVEEIAIGDTVSGRFTLESPASPRSDGSGQIDYFYQLYELEVRQGETVSAIVAAEGFAPILEAGTISVLGFVPGVAGVGAAERTSWVMITPFRSGQVVLQLRTPTLEVGSFELRVVPGVPPAR